MSKELKDGDGKVLLGKDGWLFIANDSNSVVDQHTGRLQISESNLVKWSDILKRRSDRFSRDGVRYIHIIAPDTHAIYPEFLPDSVTPSPSRPVFDFLRQISSAGMDNIVTYPLQKLKEAKQEHLVCETTGTHWTHLGGLIASVDAISRIGITSMPFENSCFEQRSHTGELGRKFSPPQVGKTVAETGMRKTSELLFDTRLPIGGLVRFFKKPNALPLRVLFQHDSYGSYMHEYLAETFSEVLTYHSPRFDYNIYDAFQPDIVLTEVAERFLISPTFDEGEGLQSIVNRKYSENQKEAPNIAAEIKKHFYRK